MSQISYGTITITDTNDIESITVEYARNQDPDTAPLTGWFTTRPDWAQGYYIWQRTRIHKSGTSTDDDTFGAAVCLTGSTGSTGAPGRSLTNTVTQYTTATSSATITEDNMGNYTWSNNVPSYSSSTPAYWVRVTNTYSNPTGTQYIIYKDNGLTDAIYMANNATVIAQGAANTATHVEELLDGHFTYGEALSQATPGGARVIEQSKENGVDVSETPSKWHHNVSIGANGISLRYNEAVMAQIAANQSGSTDTALKFYQPPAVSGNTTTQGALTMELSGNALKFYNPTTGNAQMIIGANGTLQSGNYSRGNDTKFSDSGTRIDLTYGDIITKYFRLSQGTEAGLSAGAYIYGTIEALDGKIGQGYTSNGALTNYWEIGNGTDYLLHRSAKIIGHGSSFIQLGDDSTWRLATNRIHTGWYEESIDSYLHFPEFIDGINNRYWDYGLHVPSSRNDKFIYIRNASGNYSLDSLVNDLEDTQNPSIWTYQFWVDGSGNVHAPGFYIGNSSTPIGGGAGTVAEKLMSGAGSSTRPVYVRSDTVDGVNYTGVVAPVSWDVNSSINIGSTTNDNNVATIGAIKTYVIERGYVTSSGVTSVTIAATSPVVSSTSTAQTGASVSTTISLANEYGDTQNPYGSKTKNYVLAAPSNTAGVPSFRLLVASDIPDLSATYLTSHQTVTNKSATLAWGTSKTVATIGNTDITVSLPSNPDTNTTYTFSGGTNQFTVTPSSGSAYDVIITPSIANNVTGSGTSSSLAKWSGTNTLTDGPAFTSGGTGFLKQDGTWGTPGGTYSLPVAKYNTLGGVKPAYSSTGAATLTTAAATNATTPTIAAKTTTSDRYYAIETDKNGVLFVNVPWTNVNSSYLTGITSSDVTTALGYTPYNGTTNPNGFTNNAGTVTSVRVRASAPLESSTSTEQNIALDTTIKFSNQNANVVLAGPNSGSAMAPSFRSLVAADIPNLSWTKITSDKPTTLNGYGITDAKITNGVITLGSNTITPLTSQWTANLITGASATAQDNAAASTNIYLNLVENSTVRNSHQITGSGTVSVTSDANGKITITGSAHPTSLKNPNALSIKVYNGTSTSTDTSYDGSASGQSINVAGTNAITGITSTNDGKLQLTLADGTQPTPITVKITATTSDTAASADKLNLTVDAGSLSIPVYFPASTGLPTAVTSIAYSLLPTGTGASQVAVGNHTHGNITNGGDITATAPTVANGDQIVINDHSASKITNGPTFDGSTTTQFLTKAGTWGTPIGTTYTAGTGLSLTNGEFSVKLGYTTSGNNRKVQADTNGNLYVVQTDTTYSAGTGLSLSGTTINHSNSVTAGTAGTSSATSSTDRTISIPYVTYDAQGHITGSGTHTHTLSSYPEAFLTWGGQNFSASYGPIDAAMIDVLGANRFAFLKQAGLTIEYSTNSGSTWTDYGATEAQKVGLFSSGQGFYLGKHTTAGSSTLNDQLRVTIATSVAGIYTVLNKIAIYMSTSGNTVQVKIEKALESTPTTYTTHLDWTGISGWSGWNILNISGLTTYGNTAGSQYGRIRFVFKQTAVNSGSYSAANISRIMGFGGVGWTVPSNMARDGHLYSYDSSQNATFPAKVTATGGFVGNVTGNVSGSAGSVAWSNVSGKPSNTGSSTTGITIADHGTTSVGSASNWSAGTASTWEFENKTVATAASSATSIPNVTNVGSASTWSFNDVTVPIRADSATTVPTAASSATACDDITAWSAGSGSATLSFSINGTETTNGNQLNISFSHSHTAPSLSYTPRSITGVSGSTSIYGVKSGTNSTTTASKASGDNGTAPTLGTAISITGVGGTTTVSSKKGGANSTTPSLTITSTTVVNGKSHSITDNGHTHTI